MKLYLEKTDCHHYPGPEFDYNPAIAYPEYPWGNSEVSKAPNDVYDMIRNTFAGLELDQNHFGTSDWNPLSELIHEGDTVLIKPNWVMHCDYSNPDQSLDCIVTHAAVIRAVIDYVYLGLKGTGRIILGDAPLQSCEFDVLMERAHVNKVKEFYARKNLNLEVMDFRQFTSVRRGEIIKDVNQANHPDSEYITVDMGSYSRFKGEEYREKRWRVLNYDCRKMVDHHNETRHEYFIHRAILEADVVINLPKPKTHQKTGLTGALKNLVGINGCKDWLPHHTQGDVKSGGDEYLNPNFGKRTCVAIQEAVDIRAIQGHYFRVNVLRFLRACISLGARLTYRDLYAQGSWYGNDTIWRTIHDLNRVLLYANKNGEIQKSIQRKTLAIGDMIIAGEGEGPLHPDPHPLGLVIASDDPVVFDSLVASLMGFALKKIPMLFHAWDEHELPITGSSMQAILLRTNLPVYDGADLSSCVFPGDWRFKPTMGWKDHIEQD